MTVLETIKNDLEKASTTNPTKLLRSCVSKRLVECDKVFSKSVDKQIEELSEKFDKLSVTDMGRFIKKLSRSINKHYTDYTDQLIIYRDTLMNSNKK